MLVIVGTDEVAASIEHTDVTANLSGTGTSETTTSLDDVQCLLATDIGEVAADVEPADVDDTEALAGLDAVQAAATDDNIQCALATATDEVTVSLWNTGTMETTSSRSNISVDFGVYIDEGTVEASSNSCDSEVFPLPDLSVYAKQRSTSTDRECVADGSAEGTVSEAVKPEMYVKSSSNNNGKRVFDKKHSCLFCDKSSTNLTKHLMNVHTAKSLIQEVCQLPKKSQERKHLLEKIRNMGDFKHNCTVRSTGVGEIIPWRSPPVPVPASEYVPCPDCYAFFQRSHLWRHHKDCTFCTRASRKHPFRSVVVEAELLLPTPSEMSAGLKEVIAAMRPDQYSLIMRNDITIVKYGEKLMQKHGHLKHLHHHVACKMRELARFLSSVRELDSTVIWLTDCLHASKFNIVVQAVRHLCGYSEESHQYQTPSLALKIGHSVKKCCAIVSCDSIKKGDEARRKSVDDFLFLCDKEWSSEISSAAVSSLTTKKMNKPQLLPLTEDIQTLNSFIATEIDRCIEALKSDVNVVDNWRRLSKATLAGIIVFNRKRAGEAERLQISDYNQRDENPLANTDIAESLTEVERILCQRMCRVEIRGKRGRTVPVILTPRLANAVDQLNVKRSEVGIADDNNFVFAKPSSTHVLRGSDCLHKLAVEAGTKDPASLTSTRLRKHLATTSQVLNLQECELDLLVDFSDMICLYTAISTGFLKTRCSLLK